MPVRARPNPRAHGRVNFSDWPMRPDPPKQPAPKRVKKIDPATATRMITVHVGGLNKNGELNLSGRIAVWLALLTADQLRKQRKPYQYLFTAGRKPDQFGFQRPCDLMAKQVALRDPYGGKEIIVPDREVDLVGRPDRFEAVLFASVAADRRNARLVTVL